MQHTTDQIASVADVGTDLSYQDNIEYYRDRVYQYIPIPIEREYFDVYDSKLYDMHAKQIRPLKISLIEGLRLLDNHPFVLLRRNSVDFTEDGDVKPISVPENGSQAEYIQDKYLIVTLADINRRPVKDMLYPLIAELATRLSHKIERKYTDESDLFPQLRPSTIGHWVKDREEDIRVHIAEYMNITEMKQVVKSSDDKFIRECGFPSPTQVDKQLGGIGRLRNNVMHANRSLVHSRNDLCKLLGRIERIENILEELPEIDEKPTT